MGTTIPVTKYVSFDVDVDVDLEDIDTGDLISELQSRSDGDTSERIGILRRIVWEHDILGIPLEDVIEDLMREYRVVRHCASEAVRETT